MEDQKQHHVGFIATRLAGTDGVSLETQKWANIFEREGLQCYYLAGELDRPLENSFLAELAHFRHPEIQEINRACFGIDRRDISITRQIHDIKRDLKDQIYAFIEKFQIDLLVPENALSIPLNIPLGIALTEVISETGIQTIAHHHDFYWERQRFLRNAVREYLYMAFPPPLPSIRHVVINTTAQNELGLRTGISSVLIPNIMEFERPSPPIDEYAADVRQALGIEPDELLVLQPTRIVPRKGIEHAIELIKRLGMNARLVISHAAGDEGPAYERRIREFAGFMDVKVKFVADTIGDSRKKTPAGKKIYSLADVYPHADLVTYPSTFEGFGNAFLEAIYYRKPIVMNNYSVYFTDIKPKGFKVIELDGYVTQEAVEQTREVLTNPQIREEMVNLNYTLAQKYYSYRVLRQHLKNLLLDCFGRENS